ncbi:hypothetical protein FQN57_005628 [Myotisia sp. PD_48]|nr:hypothetical protein FQN57_005628 [Myotisia sp. PD_48]
MATNSPTDELFIIRPARSEWDIRVATNLFKAYSAALGIDLAFQDFDTEIQRMPGKYAPPNGEILLAIDTSDANTNDQGCDNENEENVLGCVALRPLVLSSVSSSSSSSSSTASPSLLCEMKRLYVLPSTRGRGVGKALVHAILQHARDKGYSEMRLDTLCDMHAPIALYKRVGFVEVSQYYDTPLKDKTRFLGITL